MRLTLLGTGTPRPSLRRQSSGYLVQTPGKNLVLDHGGGAFQRLLETGLSPTDVTHLVVSHLHSDHILDIPRLVLARWDQGDGTQPPLKVVGPAPLATTFDRWFGPDGAFAPDIRARCGHPASLAMFASRGGTPPRQPPAIEVEEVAPGDHLRLEGLDIRVGRSRHFEPFLECLGYRLSTDTADIVYAGDSGFSTTIAEFASGCDLLIAMCQILEGTPLPEEARASAASHTEVARMAELAGAGTLVLTHLSDQFDDPMVRGRAHRDMAAIYGGNIVWGEDGLVLSPGEGASAARFD